MNTIRTLITILLFMFEATVSLAEPALVKSGEHDGFSRLTVSGQALGNWRSNHVAGKTQIEFSSLKEGFDISQIYSRIDRTRIKEVSSQGTSLELVLACNCQVVVFEVDPELIVIDVKDRKFPSNPNFDNPLHLGNKRRFSFGNRSVQSKTKSQSTFSWFLNQNSLKKIAVISKKPIDLSDTRKSTLKKDINVFRDRSEEILIRRLRAHLAVGFGLASTRGTLNIRVAPAEIRAPHHTQSFRNMEKVDSRSSLSDTLPTPHNLRTPIGNLESSSSKMVDTQCLPNIRFQVSAWSDNRPFDQQLSEANTNIINTLGKIDIVAVVKLARLYLFFGFGAEAKKVLSVDQNIFGQWPELYAIADIFENRPIAPIPPFGDQNSCRKPIALWSALSGNQGYFPIGDIEKEVLSELSLLPLHLREFLAPKISERFLSAGHKAASAAALQTLKRTEYLLNGQAKLKEGDVLIANKKPEDALKKYSEITSNSQAAVEAFVQKTYLRLEAGNEVDDFTFDLIDGYATEYQNTAIGSRLHKVSILSLSKAGHFTRALGKISDTNVEEQSSILKAIYSDITEFANDVVFSVHALGSLDQQLLIDSPKISLNFARRLYSLGFFAAADEYFQLSAGMGPNENRNLLGAKISIALNELATAQTYLSNEGSESAKRLKAKIFELEGRHKKAAEIYQKLGNADQERFNTWLSIDWREKFADGNGSLGKLSRVSKIQVSDSGQPVGMLTRVENMLDESRSSREFISDFLASSESVILSN